MLTPVSMGHSAFLEDLIKQIEFHLERIQGGFRGEPTTKELEVCGELHFIRDELGNLLDYLGEKE